MEQIINPKTDVVFFTGSHDKCLDWLDALLEAVIGYSLKGALNQMQTEVACGEPFLSKERDLGPFENKYTIPRYFINLLLKPYNLKIVGA